MGKLFRILRKARTSAKSGAADKSGVAAVEFAMLLPIMITLFFGTVETSLALLCRADVSIMAATAADLISQANVTTTADISNVYSAAGTLLYPYYSGGATGKPTIRLTSVVYDSTAGSPTTTGKIAWTCTQAGTGVLNPVSRSKDQSVTFSQALMTTNGSVIMAEIAYSYSSPTTQVITGAINMTNNFYTKPRRVAQIPAPTGNCPAS
jgi:Flp pilus assembly protein TadG